MPSQLLFANQQTATVPMTLPRRRGPQPLPVVPQFGPGVYQLQGPQGVTSPIASPMMAPLLVPPPTANNPKISPQHSQSSDSSSASPSLQSNNGSAAGRYGKPSSMHMMNQQQIKNSYNNEIGL
ncbi:hypothetical protein Ciccas_013206 [Cichlidogyrus casuarinus]|uniref:Uncharacterized protein n=1 Tax=Cichlidogyrus casuarinus TaxID=1844966 RepID=A0ABD2PLA8_9PLAT